MEELQVNQTQHKVWKHSKLLRCLLVSVQNWNVNNTHNDRLPLEVYVVDAHHLMGRKNTNIITLTREYQLNASLYFEHNSESIINLYFDF